LTADALHGFSAVAVAIVLEALPFLALGALVSAVIEVYVPADRLARFVPRGRLAGIGLGLVAGLVIPTCECGVVPVVRRLVKKGVPGPVAITYLLAAPVLNPVVLASTAIAFRGDLAMVLGRAGVVAVVAAAMGLLASRLPEPLLREDRDDGGHDHDHGGGGRRWGPLDVLAHGAADLLDMGRYLILGAMAAAAFKLWLPQSVFDALAGSLVASIGGSMGLAVLLSVCSEADAFVAASFVGFPRAAKVAFTAIGPMLDLKLIGMYAAAFRRPLFVALLVVPAVLVFLLSLAFAAVAG
jgi:uncharacterized membrane protein YraQ (UPF0718 family)